MLLSKKNIVHRRKLQLDKKYKKIIITDVLSNNSALSKEGFFYLHFHPKVKVIKINNIIKVTYENTKIVITNPLFSNAEIIYGNDNLPLGWYSEKYDVKEKTTTLKLPIIIEKELLLQTIIDYEKS